MPLAASALDSSGGFFLPSASHALDNARVAIAARRATTTRQFRVTLARAPHVEHLARGPRRRSRDAVRCWHCHPPFLKQLSISQRARSSSFPRFDMNDGQRISAHTISSTPYPSVCSTKISPAIMVERRPALPAACTDARCASADDARLSCQAPVCRPYARDVQSAAARSPARSRDT